MRDGSFVRSLIFLINGDCELYGQAEAQFINEECASAIEAGRFVDLDAKNREGKLYEIKKIRIPVVTLKEGSWFGDFNIMTKSKTKFEVRAMSKLNKQKREAIKIAEEKV